MVKTTNLAIFNQDVDKAKWLLISVWPNIEFVSFNWTLPIKHHPKKEQKRDLIDLDNRKDS